MFADYKLFFINYFFFLCFILFIIAFQSSFWIDVFGIHLPACLWIPCLIYQVLNRKTGETVFMIYFIALSAAAGSSLPMSYFLSFNSLMFFTLLLFKRVYYVNFMFFICASAGGFLCFPVFLWALLLATDGRAYFPNMISWLAGAFGGWVFSFPLLFIFQWVDRLTIDKRERKAELI